MSFAPKQFIRSVDFLSTENAINTSTGSVNIYGGMSVSKNSYLTNMIVVGNTTVANLNITGTLTTSTGNTLISSQWTSIDSNTDIYFGTSANSFVGIGTTTPGFTLDISGGSRITGALTVGNLNVNTGATITNILNTTICTGTIIITSGSLNASFNSNTIGNIFTTGGNVGINTTSPTNTLEVNGTLKANDITVGNINFTGNLFQNGSTYLGSQWTTTSGNTLTYTSGNISVNKGFTSSFNSNTIGNIFTTSGNVGINTTSPTNTLEVNGTLKANDITVGNINFIGNLFQNGSAYLGSQWTTTSGNTLTYTSGNISINKGFTSSFNSNTIGNIFTTGGNVGINTSSPNYALQVIGDIYTTGDVISFSDSRLKSDIVTIDNALNKVSSMRGVYYTNIKTQQRDTGVIAQEIAEILPEVVADKGEYLGVAYGNIVGILIEAIKELKTRIIELENS